jgi:ferritin-like metal-binding protein YciE
MADDITKMMTEQLRDAYSAEKQALRVMPRLMKKASSPALRELVQMHAEQTEGHVERLERALEAVGGKPGRKVCEGMRGIIEEAQSEAEDQDRGPMLDVILTAALQRVEHYEIAAYGTIAALAQAAGEEEVARLMAETLREEKETDQKLTQLAESELNPAMLAAVRGEALEEDEEDEDAEEAPRGGEREGARRPAKPANDRRGGRRSSAS